MNTSMRDKIDSLVRTIQDVYHIITPIDDVEHVVHVLGGSIQVDYSISGSVIEKAGDSFRILMGSYSFSSYKGRFTVAVEIGHLFLHMGYKIDSNRWYSIPDGQYTRLWNSEEYSLAYEFASSFLMPVGLVYSRVRKETHDGVVDISKLSNYFLS